MIDVDTFGQLIYSYGPNVVIDMVIFRMYIFFDIIRFEIYGMAVNF